MSDAIEKRRPAALSPRKQSLLHSLALPLPMEEEVMMAVKEGASDFEAAQAAGLTLDELEFVFSLAEKGHEGYRKFRDEYFRARHRVVLDVKAAQLERAKDPERGIADRRYMLATIDAERYPEKVVEKAAAGPTMIVSGNTTFDVRTKFSPGGPDQDDVVDAEVVE